MSAGGAGGWWVEWHERDGTRYRRLFDREADAESERAYLADALLFEGVRVFASELPAEEAR